MKNLFILVCCLLSLPVFSQPFRFAVLSDTHIGVKNADEDLRISVADINSDTSIKFVIVSGDVTDVGSDEEVLMAKKILSGLKKPLYVLTGNHDGNWSPTGGRIFNKAFGSGRFAFQQNGYLFVGTNSGPFMHHRAPGQVPREDILWMDSVLNRPSNRNMPVVYTNHYPQDSSQRNWFEAIDRLKKKNIQLILVGHGHLDTEFSFEGIPGIMCRSNLRDIDSASGYTVVSIAASKAIFNERKPLLNTLRQWADVKLYQHNFANDTVVFTRPSYVINKTYPTVKLVWKYSNGFDIGAGTSYYQKSIIATNTRGDVYALNASAGNRLWTFHTQGKIYSTPVVALRYIIVASTDTNVFCLNANNGRLVWKSKLSRPIVASPVVQNNIVYIGSSEGVFYALDLPSGKVKWKFQGVKDFVMTKPLLYAGKLFFGSWGNEFYALDAKKGSLAWKWVDTSHIRMNSPAGCIPVGAAGKVFIVAPDQYMTAFDANTGKMSWRSKDPSVRVRESMGLSTDSSMVYVKTSDGRLIGISTSSNIMQTVMNVNLSIGYDISAAPVVESNGIVYVPSNSGVVSAIGRQTKKLLWKHKVSNSNINSIMPLNTNTVIVSSEDGSITCLQW